MKLKKTLCIYFLYTAVKIFLFAKNCKGQIILTGLFGVLEFSQKWTNKFENDFACLFFGRIRRYQKSFCNYLAFRVEYIFSNIVNQIKKCDVDTKYFWEINIILVCTCKINGCSISIVIRMSCSLADLKRYANYYLLLLYGSTLA